MTGPVRVADLLRYVRELGWRPEELELPATPARTPVREGSAAAAREDLARLALEVAACRRCPLAAGRTQTVFGEGDSDARLMFVGEGPGREEDRTGRPFVGQAGKLLDAMIRALGLAREQVYIANVVKCRPPGNETPKESEAAACAPYLDGQIDAIRPEIIVALGKPAARRLTGSRAPMKALRGKWFRYRGARVTVTYHPAYLLRYPRDKRLVWEDLRAVRAALAE